ncbi:hypothetical protein F4859DRAFT_363124 [Xylaria cf. heliscus]|nr:hypothetical protein F4859DRAFT_363124 [Xylaria cf. heliscus]
MCLILDVMCPKTKTKSKSSSKSSKKCQVCIARKVAREELDHMYQSPGTMPVTYQNQHGYDYNYGYGYGYGDWSTWEENQQAFISNKKWKDHTQTAQNAYESAQENGKKIGEVKNSLTSEIKEAQKAIQDTHASVVGAISYAEGTRAAIDLAHAGIKSTHVAVKEAQLAIQDAISDKHAEHMSKQEECAAGIARVRQLLEEEARQREETRRVQEMVRYAQSQGLLPQTPARDHDRRSRSSRSSSPATSTTTTTSSSGKTRSSRRSRAEEEKEANKQKEWELQQQYTKAIHANTKQLLQQGQELEYNRRRDPYFHHPRFQGGGGAYYDDGIEALPPFNAYPYGDYYGTGVGGGVGYRGPRGQVPRCGNARPSWDH